MIERLGRSIRARLALFASVAMALLCLAAGALSLWVGHRTAVDIRTKEVTSAALHVGHDIQRNHMHPLTGFDLNGLQVVDSTGRVVASTPNLEGVPRLTTVVPDPSSPSRTDVLCRLPQLDDDCHITASVRVFDESGDWFVYAYDATVPWYIHPYVIAVLALVSAALVAITWFGVSKVVARTLAPVNQITRQLTDISYRDEIMRVAVPEKAEEIKALAEAANRTLARLEAAMDQQRRFASDASHDLRSPITAMRAELESAMLAPDETDWRETGGKLMASLDRLQNIVADLLTLARLEAGAPSRLESVDLAELVAAETTRPRSKKIVTALQPGVVVTGDRLKLARLLTNLLDNAERHAESTIIVTLRRNEEAVLEVLDDGAGIAPDQREVVFRRFTRLDASRSRDAGGTGLGLPIAREIAQAHHGTLKIEDSDTGARFVLRLPIRKE
ncbi:HAMP domain-containing sensor histidine kinase [Nonomuraea sp. NPDC005650]|uniref:sensor histidine kinase n=1 Tax=Nonomuraea sp. NPDC005650 TaxID=3157045 RepID=UPI0033AC7F1F